MLTKPIADRVRTRVYDEAIRLTLIVLWEVGIAADPKGMRA